jgi:putative ABC transport system permease protein
VIFSLAVRGLARRWVATIAVALLACVAVAADLGVVILEQGVEHAVLVGQRRLGADISIVARASEAEVERAIESGTHAPRFLDETIAGALGNVRGVVSVVPKLVLPTASHCCSMDHRHEVFGVPIHEIHRVGSDPTLGPEDVVVGSDVQGAKLGEQVRVYNLRFRVAAVLPPTGTPLDRAIYMELDVARKHGAAELGLSLPEHGVSSVELRVERGRDLATMADQIERAVPEVQAVTSTELFRSARVLLDQLRIVVAAAALITGIIGVVAIGAISILVGRSRRRELGILRALGAGRAQLFSIVVVETALNAGIGAILGALIVTVAAILLEGSVSGLIPFLLAPARGVGTAALLAVIFSIALGALSSVAAASAAARLDPFEALRERA